jgi:hypothetical protein
METSTANRNFVKQMSLDEYNKQTKEYTKKALLELKSQMATYKSNQDTTVKSDSYDDESEDSADTADVNVIIKTYKDSNTGLKRRRKHTPSTDKDACALSNTIYLQRELDLQEIQKLKTQLKKINSILEEEQRKNHFLKLELCNAQVDNSDLKNALVIRDNKIKNLENTQNANWWQIVKIKLFLGLLVVLYIYIILF